MNFPRLTVDDVKLIHCILLAFAAGAEALGDNHAAEKYRMLAARITEIA